MMKNTFYLFVLFVYSTLFLSSAQLRAQPSDIKNGLLRIKVTEKLAARLERTGSYRTAGGVLQTGYRKLDQINRRFGVLNFRRVFRSAGRFEERHRSYGLHRWYELQLHDEASVKEAVEVFGEIEEIEITEPVHTVALIGEGQLSRPMSIQEMNTLTGPSNDPLLGAQWHYHNIGQTGGATGADIRLIDAWGVETGREDVIVAIMDHGIDVNHPDLSANMWVNPGEIPGNGLDDDDNGYVDDVHGYGFGDDTGNFIAGTHGTHVAGTVAATSNNGIGVAGIAGGSGTGDGVRLMSCAVFGANANDGFAESFVYAADMGAVISQNSWAFAIAGKYSQAVLDAIDYFIAEAGRDDSGNQVGPMNGGIAIFAAGNSNRDRQVYPAYYDPTLAVAASSHQDTKAWYSCFGDWVDISAPGGEIFSAAEQGGILSTLPDGQYGYLQGTSMACPHVSGVAALVVSRFGGQGFSASQLRIRLVGTTDFIDDLNPGYEGKIGSGRLNALAALQTDDGTAPEPVDDLSVRGEVGKVQVTLEWTAPSDPGNGRVGLYDIRYSTSPISESNFNVASRISYPKLPGTAGMTDSVTVKGLSDTTRYYFAMKAIDPFGNISALSNVLTAVTRKGSPEAVFKPLDTLDFGTVFAEEVTHQIVDIVNMGTDELIIQDIISHHASFVHWVPDSILVKPLDTYRFLVGFTADTLGTVTGNLSIYTSDTTHSVHQLVLKAQVLEGPADIHLDPDSIAEVHFVPGISTRTVTISNVGELALQYEMTQGFINSGHLAFGIPGKETGFEEFPLGDISGKNNWQGTGSCLVENENPYSGNQHFRLIADSMFVSNGQSAGFYAGSEAYSSLTMMMNLDNAAESSWIFRFESSHGSVTLLQINTDRSMEMLTGPEGNSVYQTITADIPPGYFEFRIDVERSTSMFTVYFNGVQVFYGQGAASEVSRMSFTSYGQSSGPVIDIDNLTIWNGQPGWFDFNEETGSIPVGESVTVAATFDSRLVPEGAYEAFIRINTNDPDEGMVELPVYLIVGGDLVRVEPDSIYQELATNEMITQTITVYNYSDTALNYTVRRRDPVAPAATGQATSSLVRSTDFETWQPGPVMGQNNWTGQYNWIIDNSNPFSGDQHLRFKSSGLGGQVATSPSLNTSSSPYSSLTMMINLDSTRDGRWVIAPQAFQGTVTILNIEKDLSVNVRVTDSLEATYSHTIPYPAPSGYFELGIEVEKATSQFTVYFDRFPVFTGLGGVGNIAKVFFVAHAKTAGSILDIDNFSIREGTIPPWFTPQSSQIAIPARGAVTFDVSFDATDLLPGSYTATLVLDDDDDDDVNPDLNVPVTLVVQTEGVQENSVGVASVLEDPGNSPQLSLYPVPTTDHVKLDVAGIGDGPVELSLINSQGQVVYQEVMSALQLQEKHLSLESIGLSQGVYFLKLRSAEVHFTNVIIKK